MQTTEFTFVGAGGVQIFATSWLPGGAPRDQLVLAHGYAEHLGRYRAVAEFFTAAGYAVHALDHRGHGKSGGTRAVIDSFANADADIDQLVDKVRADSGLQRIKLVGHSMGGSLALNYALNHPEKLSGLVLSGPAIGGGLPKIQNLLLALISRIAPALGMIQLDADAVSRDPQVVAAYKADPLVFHGKVPARTAREMMHAVTTYPPRVGVMQLPCLLMHGSADTLVRAEDAQPVFDAIASPDKTVRIFDGLYHEIFNEPERLEVLGIVKDWLGARAPV
ncbi:alpha/beta hydrolase [Novosphingobium ginsenosidimutans]|uniref:Monoacylglycerol lipase n=1 Tax=Novosphingobium ginsenosidimutans TaxID=1176536 RepID=A0A5B8S5N6_9SPHN|nr:alpha/beta hydrolase [Novosphingobium ginsenosidimutans]QEA16896.1 lysophospholipase [Novosphingobium ginsenosidimutans]